MAKPENPGRPANPGERGRNMAAQKRQRNAERQAANQQRDRTPDEEEAPVQDGDLEDVTADSDEGQETDGAATEEDASDEA